MTAPGPCFPPPGAEVPPAASPPRAEPAASFAFTWYALAARAARTAGHVRAAAESYGVECELVCDDRAWLRRTYTATVRGPAPGVALMRAWARGYALADAG